MKEVPRSVRTVSSLIISCLTFGQDSKVYCVKPLSGLTSHLSAAQGALKLGTIYVRAVLRNIREDPSSPSYSSSSAATADRGADEAFADASGASTDIIRSSFKHQSQVKTTLPKAPSALLPVVAAAAPAHAAVMRTRTNYGSPSTFFDDDDGDYGRRPRRRTQPASFGWKTECKPTYRRTEMSSSSLNSPEALNRIIFDLLCVWHDLKRPSEAVPTSDLGMSDKRETIGKIIFRLTSEIDQRINHLTADAAPRNFQEFAEEWCLLTWNLISVTTRLRSMEANDEEKSFLFKLNNQLIFLVNKARAIDPPLKENDVTFTAFHDSFATTLHTMHNLYQSLDHIPTAMDAHEFAHNVALFGQHDLFKFLEAFKAYCHVNNTALWHDVRAAQAHRMVDFNKINRESVTELVKFYTTMMYTLGIVTARLQGFRHECVYTRGLFSEHDDPVWHLMEMAFSAFELLLNDCILATEPSTNAILVTNNLFPMKITALAHGVLFRDFSVQIVSEEVAQQIQSEVRRQKLLEHSAPLGFFPSAALLAMKPSSGVKRNNATASADGGNTAHKKSDVNSKEAISIAPSFHTKHRCWMAKYPHLLCTTRQKDTVLDSRSGQIGKRPLFYFYVKAEIFSPSGKFFFTHTLSLPFTIATRRNQDCQVQRMMSSYTATCFWLYGAHIQDGLMLNWFDNGIQWETFKHLFSQHFKVNCDISRGFVDEDYELLKQKSQCAECAETESVIHHGSYDAAQKRITFKNILCPHLRYDIGKNTMRFSIWRGMLELLQMFSDQKTTVKDLWEKFFLMGFIEHNKIEKLLAPHEATMCLRLSFINSGSVCFTVKTSSQMRSSTSDEPTIMHLEPLDLKRLQAKSLAEYLRDIAVAEKIEYLMTAQNELIPMEKVFAMLHMFEEGPKDQLRDITSNVAKCGGVEVMQHVSFTALRVAVVTRRLEPPVFNSQGTRDLVTPPTSSSVFPNGNSDFLEKLQNLMNENSKTREDVIELLQMQNGHGHDYYMLPFAPVPPTSTPL
uniref:PINc domain-containing protein n=1 Tax=Steinernema glaseri TaxID=37863 RepID=A0A1I7YVU8_9BILA